jgi:hypothetical protein
VGVTSGRLTGKFALMAGPFQSLDREITPLSGGSPAV